ncbi:MAG: tRNA (adenosine(37)-N6)-dimethylallyltransferase MiaA [Cyanobacteriota bacterium]|nr:tRNA (adenosine(37)-N6)-dimethylallyltransferase MiaA [Cyanobacteriota bacterium]MDY6358049.1 tRNA (adenosine(37)-N6)-dimethylallyltransferase MiaA [Cyanobacteriota bacterium]MDY6363891.1 tRNA (adenosine(37)-N6)-dimethylallyltransferase MiaA [Cyanobacteriota bacterium]MDY6383340.1 tRNA (adenosine(37)-N6)-dimethylallyltransferase MiaA [Cyanobacteriota bacterium]
MKNKIKVIAIVGPTASGKTAYSIELAKQIGGEIISADSRLVYMGFNIGAAKPTFEEMDGIPHYMIGIVEPEIMYSAGLYKKEAQKLILDIHNKGKIPIVVGGTGLYVDTLLKGYNLPDAKPDYELRKKLEQNSTDDLYSMLLKKDKSIEKFIDSKDRKKIIRALEIIEQTGDTLSNTRSFEQSQFDVEWIGRNLERDALYKRINDRVDLMVEQGLIDETKDLLKKHGRIYNLVNTIGYREIIKYLDGEMTLKDCLELLKKNTRNYAKRQLTWFRRNDKIKWNIYPEKLKK